eukprot:TRINITY_DN46917_c0_g1_i1.p1 TRINITY_DN46917_c0_g1~~TRINITY_DN46917_c0_g1_i1.p1  ORF type:complete len:579 (+),score=124.55 TRINITY_DN46917_c0_g1_i1:68-1804(+)
MPRRAAASRLTLHRWMQLQRRGPSPKNQHVLRYALLEADVERMFGMRHRLLSRYPRTLVQHFAGQQYNSVTTLTAGGQNLRKAQAHTGPAAWMNYDPAKTPHAFFAIDMRGTRMAEAQCTRALYEDLHATGVQAGQRRQATVSLIRGVSDGWGCRVTGLVRISNASAQQLSSVRSWGLQQHGVQARLRPFQLSESSRFPVIGVRHRVVLCVRRGPVTGSTAAALRRLKRCGFLNYHPPASFRGQVPGLVVGAAILQGDWRTAVELMLLDRATVSATAKKVWKMWRDGVVGWHGEAEYSFATESVRVPVGGSARDDWRMYSQVWGPEERRNYRRAFEFAHVGQKYGAADAVRRYLWNYVASLRIAAYGARCVEGDVVLSDDGPVLVESAEEAARYSIYDVVLPDVPLPWSSTDDVLFPRNDINYDLWLVVLADFGITPTNFERDRTLQATGRALRGVSYRRLVVVPRRLEWRLTRGSPDEVWDGQPRQQGAAPDTRLKLEVVADLPMDSSIQSLFREVCMVAPRRNPIPRLWQLWPDGKPHKLGMSVDDAVGEVPEPGPDADDGYGADGQYHDGDFHAA